MITKPSPLPSAASEAARAQSLAAYGILDTEREQAYDDLAELAAALCRVPLAAVTFFDGERQWFKSMVGADVVEAPMAYSFCTYTCEAPDEVMVVADATADERFATAPHVIGEPRLRAYAGVALVDPSGVPLGTICVFDVEARGFDESQQRALTILSRQVISQLELRRRVTDLATTAQELTTINAELEQFGYIVGHDLKAPIRQQTAFAEAVLEDYAAVLPEEVCELLRQCSLAGKRTQRVLDDINDYLHSTALNEDNLKTMPLGHVFASLKTLVAEHEKVDVVYDFSDAKDVGVVAAPVRHILANLIGNAIKYNDKPRAEIFVLAKAANGLLTVAVSDNGPGIHEADLGRVFQLFSRGRNAADAEGRGMGLAISAKLARGLGGKITVANRRSGGTKFELTFPIQDRLSPPEQA